MEFLSQRLNNKNKNSRNNYRGYYGDNLSFSKYKSDLYSFKPNPDVEEIPTFTFENDRNLDYYKDRISDKEALIEMNAKNYINYIKKFERKKTPISSPYSVYLKMKDNKTNNYGGNDNYVNHTINNDKNYESEIDIKKQNKINNLLINNNYFQNKEKPFNLKPLSNSLSMKTINLENRKSEITNPELYYKRNNEDYNKYRAELKEYLDYNYQVLMNKKKLNKRQEIDINPYNPIDADFEHYKSDLAHNPILNPINNYSFNKYLQKEIKGINKNSISSTFRQAGNLLINK